MARHRTYAAATTAALIGATLIGTVAATPASAAQPSTAATGTAPTPRATSRAAIKVRIMRVDGVITWARATSGARKVLFRFVTTNGTISRTVRSGAKTTIPVLTTTVKVRTIATSRLRPSRWETVNVKGSGRQPTATQEAEVLALTNEARSQARMCGDTYMPAAPPLTGQPGLANVARAHSIDMDMRNFFSHKNPDGQYAADRVAAAGYTWTLAVDNIAAGQMTPALVMHAWLTSPGHCQAIMSTDFTHLGVGYHYRTSSKYLTYWTQVFAG